MLRRIDEISETKKLIYAQTTVRLEEFINGEWQLRFRLREASHYLHNPMLYNVATYPPNMKSFENGVTYQFAGRKQTREFIKEKYGFNIPADAFDWFRSVDMYKRMVGRK